MPRGRRKGTARAVGVSAEVLTWALDGLQREIAQTKERLTELTARASEVRAALDQGRAPAEKRLAVPVQPAERTEARPAGRRRKRRLSAEGRRRIKEALKRRWQRYHEQQARKAQGKGGRKAAK
ncbi:MAG: hypothetical protein GEU99_10470 [Luteitalea sp.]|nr:hypothetical protein [Luteitalea sp.]